MPPANFASLVFFSVAIGTPEPPRPIDELIGWHRRTGWELDGGFFSYTFVQDTVEDIAACWRACEIRDAGLRRLRGES